MIITRRLLPEYSGEVAYATGNTPVFQNNREDKKKISGRNWNF